MTLSKKLWLTFLVFVIVTVGSAFGLAYILYEKLYVDSVKEELVSTAKKLAYDYEGGELDQTFIDQVNWFSEKSHFEAFAVRNPRELAACIPYEADYDTLIGPEEREQLLQNKIIEETGYSERFDRQIISIIVPLLEDRKLNGIIYLYVPLERIDELASSLVIYWTAGAVVIMSFLLAAGMKWTRHLTKPLKDMQSAAVRLSKGDYSARVSERSNDELGMLSKTFNEMANAIETEDELRKTFLATVSHELRTPLSYIKGYSEAAMNGMEGKEKQIAIIHRESKRMERLVNDLLELIRLDSGKMKVDKMPLPFAEIVYRTVETFRPAAKNKMIHFDLNIDEDVIVNGDEGRLEQVMTNILDNAIRYSNKGGMIQITMIQEKETMKLLICDNGVGIQEEELPRITERFYRVNKARTRNDGGSGLGLSIVKQIIELHDGELRIESMEGEGTTVIILLPVLT
ncbi:sensor histidine kinase [Domibacillus epiphyticus]|nr:HAMP domain-containing sensor histidine kinase [Domibacillus epiphyticus]